MISEIYEPRTASEHSHVDHYVTCIECRRRDDTCAEKEDSTSLTLGTCVHSVRNDDACMLVPSTRSGSAYELDLKVTSVDSATGSVNLSKAFE